MQMKSIVINGKTRSVFGKKEANKERKHNEIPCVLSGGKETLHFTAPLPEFHPLYYSPEAFLVDLMVDGVKHHATLQDSQFHPVSDKLLHVDFKEIFDDKEVTIKVPLLISGNSIGVRNGGKLRQRRRDLKIRALPNLLPDHLEIDITDLDIGKSVNVVDLKFPDIEILDLPNVQIVAVISARAALKGMEEVVPAAGATAEAVEGAAVPAAEGAAAPGAKGAAPAAKGAAAPAAKDAKGAAKDSKDSKDSK
jgi:large subunit ribosomal protein L25